LIVKNHIGIRLVFKHDKDERNLFVELKKELFPFPNQFETEIMRILTEVKREKGILEYSGIVNLSNLEREKKIKDGIPIEYVDKITETHYLPDPNDFIPSFCEYSWEQKKITEKSQNNHIRYVKKIKEKELTVFYH
jgi:hypothetical protein